MNTLTTLELKRFLYIQGICLLIAAAIFTFASKTFTQVGSQTHWVSIVIMASLAVGVLAQLTLFQECRQKLLCLGAFYSVLTVVMIGLLFI